MKQLPGGNARPRRPPGTARLEPPQDPASARCTESAGRPGHAQVGPSSCLWAGRINNINITILKEVKNRMKVLQTDNDDNNNHGAMTRSEREALAQLEASSRGGQVVFHPWVGQDTPAPHCVVLPEGLTRIAATYLEDEYWVRDGQWHRRDDEGAVTPVDDVLERCWQVSAMAVRSWLKRELDISAYVVAAAVFATMEPDESILAAAASRSTRVLFGLDDHVERLAALPVEQDLQHPLQARYIPDDAAALSRRPEAAAVEPEPETATLELGEGRVVIHAGTVHLHLTIVAPPHGGDDGVDGLPTVPDR